MAELAMLADTQWTVYPAEEVHPLTARHGTGQGKFTGHRPVHRS